MSTRKSPESVGEDNQAVELFFDATGIRPGQKSLIRLGDAAQAFSRLPYENISKLLKTERQGSPDSWRRMPLEVIGEHLRFGMGGTCFSLTQLFRRVVESMGFETSVAMAHTPSGPNHHCALLVRQGEGIFLVDPGYLICEPVTLPDDKSVIATPRGELRLIRDRSRGDYLLEADVGGQTKTRYRLDPRSVTDEEFNLHWEASFEWPSMSQLVATRYNEDGQLYLHNRHLRSISKEGVQKRNLSDDLEDEVSRLFGMDRNRITRARELVNKRRTKRKI